MPALVKRSPVEEGRPYSEYRQDLRTDFCWSCAYCSICEAEAQGIEMQIDHYVPQASGGVNDYENLYYACAICNRRKSGWCPTGDPDRDLIRIDQTDPADHIKLGSDRSHVAPLTPAGSASIERVDLNRWALRQLRHIRAEFAESDEVIANGLRMLRKLSIDALPPAQRAKFVELRQKLESLSRSSEAELEDFLERHCSSRLFVSSRSPREERLRVEGAFLPRRKKHPNP